MTFSDNIILNILPSVCVLLYGIYVCVGVLYMRGIGEGQSFNGWCMYAMQQVRL